MTGDTKRCAHCGKEVERRNGNPFLPFNCPIHGDLKPSDLESWWDDNPHAGGRRFGPSTTGGEQP